jgi:hypothetical protein
LLVALGQGIERILRGGVFVVVVGQGLADLLDRVTQPPCSSSMEPPVCTVEAAREACSTGRDADAASAARR